LVSETENLYKFVIDLGDRRGGFIVSFIAIKVVVHKGFMLGNIIKKR